MILGLNKESKNPGSALNAHSVVPIQLGPTDPQVPLANVEHKQHRCRYDDRVWPVAPTLGIGTTSPSALLTMSGSETTTNGMNAALRLVNTSAAGGNTWILRAGAAGTSTPDGGFSIGDNSAYRLAITNTGNVGIGTTAPITTLDVAGTVRTSARLTILASDSSNTWNLDNTTGYLRLFREDLNGSNGSVKMALLNNGNVGIGTTAPAALFNVSGGASTAVMRWDSNGHYGIIQEQSDNNFLIANGGSGGMYLAGSGAVAWSSNSDLRLKHDINPLSSSLLDRILALNPVTFSLEGCQARHRSRASDRIHRAGG